MASQKEVRFEGAVGEVIKGLNEGYERRQEGDTAAAAVVMQYREENRGIKTVGEKKAVLKRAYKARQRQQEKRLLLNEHATVPLGGVLKNQRHLFRREMYRRRLFPVRFDTVLCSSSEVHQLMMERPSLLWFAVYCCYLCMLLLFISFSVEITRLFEASDGLRQVVGSVEAPSADQFNALSYLAAQNPSAGTTLEVNADNYVPTSLWSLSNKLDAASWLLYAFVPLLYDAGYAKQSQLGAARVVGHCFRLTLRLVNLETQGEYNMGYEATWPISSVPPSSTIHSSHLLSVNPLQNSTSARLKYSYPFAPAGESKSYSAEGGYYQVICQESLENAQEALMQNQSFTRFPPWFVPGAPLGERRTASAVVDFFIVNGLTKTFSHAALLFSFASSGSMSRPQLWVSSLSNISTQENVIIRYTALSLMLLFLGLTLVNEYQEIKGCGLRTWALSGWSWLLAFHIVVLLGFLSSFAALQVLFALSPSIHASVGADGMLQIEGAPEAADEDGFFTLVECYAPKFTMANGALTSCAVFGSLSAVTGCIYTLKYVPAVGSLSARALQVAFGKAKYHILACSSFMLVVLLVFVSLGNIAFGAYAASFTGYYESLTTSAAVLLGGTVGNYDIYGYVDISPVLSGLFFVTLFFVLSFFGLTVLTAIVLRKYDNCSDDIEHKVQKFHLCEQGIYRTRYEWLSAHIHRTTRTLFRRLCRCREKEVVTLVSEDELNQLDGSSLKVPTDAHNRGAFQFQRHAKNQKDPKLKENSTHFGEGYYEEELLESPPQYPDWVWKTMGCQDPYSIYGSPALENQQGFYVDPSCMQAYLNTYGGFREYKIHGLSNQQDVYYKHVMDTRSTQHSPVPTVAKVYTLMRNHIQDDHEDAWKKLFVFIFVALVVATLCLQLALYAGGHSRQMFERGIARTTFSVEPLSLLLKDDDLGLQDLSAIIKFSPRPVFTIRTQKQFYRWLADKDGLMSFLTHSTEDALYSDAYPKLVEPDGKLYRQLILRNWNTCLLVNSVRMTLELFEESSFATSLGFECSGKVCENQQLFSPESYSLFLQRLVDEHFIRDVLKNIEFQIVTFNASNGGTVLNSKISISRNKGGSLEMSTSVDAFAIVSVCLFAFFFLSFFVEFSRLYRALREERPEDFSCGLCVGVFFFDDLFNLLDVVGFLMVAAAVVVWVVQAFSSTHSSVFDLQTNLTTAASAGTEADAAAAALSAYDAFSSTASWIRTYAQVSAVIVAFSFLRLLRLGRKRRRLTILFSTISAVVEEILQMLAASCLLFVGFSVLCFVSFGSTVKGFATLQDSFFSTFMLTLGYFPVSQLFASNTIMAAAFIFPYLFSMSVVCSCFFLSVVLRSLEHRDTEIKLLERLGKIEDRTIYASLRLFIRELFCCRFRRTAKQIQEDAAREAEAKRVQELEEAGRNATAFGRRTDSDDELELLELQNIEGIERRRRERPLPVVDLPEDVVTTVLSDEQYASLPEAARIFAGIEASSLVDRFRRLHTQLSLCSGDVLTLLRDIEDDVYSELLQLSREVMEQEGHLQHQLSVYNAQVIVEQQRLATYSKFLEQALYDKEQELEICQQEASSSLARAGEEFMQSS